MADCCRCKIAGKTFMVYAKPGGRSSRAHTYSAHQCPLPPAATTHESWKLESSGASMNSWHEFQLREATRQSGGLGGLGGRGGTHKLLKTGAHWELQ